MFRSPICVSPRIRAVLSALAFLVAGKLPSLADQTQPTNPHSLAELLKGASKSPTQQDVALANLLCAEGLPGAEGLDIQASLALLDSMALRVASETARNRYRFERNAAEFESSEAYFKMIFLVVVLQEDFGIHYNPAKISAVGNGESDEVFFADSNDILINGLLGARRAGTCSSMPVLYAAVGRRLGYPLKLVTAKAHLFVRWDDGKERLNLEATNRGLSVNPDSYYKNWPYPITAEEEQRGLYLKNLTAPEEIALCLEARSQVLKAHKRFAEAADMLRQAMLLAPRWAEMHVFFLRDIGRVQRTQLADNERPPFTNAEIVAHYEAMIRFNNEQHTYQERLRAFQQGRAPFPLNPLPPQPPTLR